MSECNWEKEFYKKMCNNYKDLDGKDCHNLKGSDPQRIIDFFCQKEKEWREEERKRVLTQVKIMLKQPK